MKNDRQLLRLIGSFWGLGGVLLLFGWAVYRLMPHVLGAINSGLSSAQWILMIVWCGFMLYSEGYQGIGRGLAGRIAERSLRIYRRGDWIEIVLAPLYVMSYFRAIKTRLIISYSALILIIVAVLIVQQFNQPWRGIVDAGVVLGLTYGIGAIIWRTFRLFANHQLKVR